MICCTLNVECALSCNLLREIVRVFCASVYTLYFVNSVWLYRGTSDQCAKASWNVHVYHFQILHFYILHLYILCQLLYFELILLNTDFCHFIHTFSLMIVAGVWPSEYKVHTENLDRGLLGSVV